MSASTGRGYDIRECRAEDLDQILEIESEAFPDPYDLHTFTQLLASEPQGFFVAEANKMILGYVAAIARGGRAMIYSIAVSKGHAREGIGRELLVTELRYLSLKADTVQLQVGLNNSAARALYSSLSFVELRRIRRYYQSGEDAILMELDLRSLRDVKRQ